MPKRTDIHKILVIGSGPIVIGQAAEFDYAGTQACLALREEGYEVILINSNPATIMTDTNIADKVYMEPLTLEYVSRIIRKERPDAILPTLRSFEGVEHRLEPCGEIDGVEYVNDSKATNVDSVWYALESMTRPVVWIAGGTDKGNDYSRLYDLAGAKVKALVCMGVDNEKLIRAFDGRIPRIEDTHSLDDAMAAARAAASSGDTVLLSPACASFDLFKNYEERGRQFKEWVATLSQKHR